MLTVGNVVSITMNSRDKTTESCLFRFKLITSQFEIQQDRYFDRITTDIIQNSNDGTEWDISLDTVTCWNQKRR